MGHAVNVHDAKSQLSKLVAMPQRGDVVVITIHGKPAVRLVPVKPDPIFGLRGDWPQVPFSSLAPMTDDELADNFGPEFANMPGALPEEK